MSAESRTDLLIEIGTEELPPTSLGCLSQALAQGLAERLEAAGLSLGAWRCFATPRRLAVYFESLPRQLPARQLSWRGPSLAHAFDATGQPTAAAQGFARRCGLALDQLQQDKKSGHLRGERTEPGGLLTEQLSLWLQEVLNRLPIARRMRWGEGKQEFVRPVRWLLMMASDAVIKGHVLGCPSGRESWGHRSHAAQPLILARASDYVAVLQEQGRVMVDMAARRTHIQRLVEQAATEQGGEALYDDALLDEVCALVEWPMALVGSFDTAFLSLPEAVLRTTLTAHQRYFPMRGPDQRLLPHFVVIVNIASSAADQLRLGNERVVRPRLADAAFFLQQDRQRGLASLRPALADMEYQQGLGSLLHKSQRLEHSAAAFAALLEADTALAQQAATLCKCDLLTHMVAEFPALQGVMGRQYALDEGVVAAVALAIEQHYQPLGAQGALPDSPLGLALALADRLDHLLGLFALGRRPSGTRDPFGARRAAIAVLRILLERTPLLALDNLLQIAAEPLPEATAEVRQQLMEYFSDRLRVLALEQGYSAEIVAAVLVQCPTYPADSLQRMAALQTFFANGESASVFAACRRLRNLLRGQDLAAHGIDTRLLQHPAEQHLHRQYLVLEERHARAMAARDYDQALALLQPPTAALERFFTEVLVMVEEHDVRANRLALLHGFEQRFTALAELSLLHA